MGAFDTLARLAKQAVDAERQVLQTIDATILEAEQKVENLRAQAAVEAGHGQDFMTTGATLSAYLRANKLKIQEAQKRLQALRAAHGIQLKKLQQQLVEQKRCEALVERQRKRLADEAAAKEQKEIDDFVTIKSGRVARPRR